MSTLYEYYNTGDDASSGVYGATWKAQTFTPSIAHKITSVKLKFYRTGSPGTLTVGIRATDGSGHPTGEDLCSGTIDGNSLTTDTAGAWYEITLGAGYNLAASTKYAIVARAPSGDINNRARWLYDSTSSTYTGGNIESSTNSGSSWTSSTGYDFMFEDWGEGGAVTPKTSSDTGSGTEASAQTATLTKAETGTGVEGLLARILGLTETGAGLDVVAQAQAMLVGTESGVGVDVYVSLEIVEAKSSSDIGSGVEGTPMPSASLAGSETGSSIDAIIARLLAAFDTGYGVEAGDVEIEGLFKNLFASELGEGIDALVVKREIFAGGEGTKFFGGGHEPPHRAS